MPFDLAGWIPQTGAVSLLLIAVFGVLSGRIIPRTTHEEVRRDRDIYRVSAEKALTASTEMSGHVSHLVSSVEALTVAQRETLELVRRLVTDRGSREAP